MGYLLCLFTTGVDDVSLFQDPRGLTLELHVQVQRSHTPKRLPAALSG